MLDPAQENPYPDSHTLGEGPEPHPQLRPVLHLLGRWHGQGSGEYPTLEHGFRYEQEITFSHDGRPFLRYESRAWLVDESGAALRPSGREVGWWRVMPDASLEVVLAHPTGIVETYVGQVSGTEIEIATQNVSVTPRAKEVTAMRRRYTFEEGELTIVQEMEAVGQPMQHHLKSVLRPHKA
ncbi:MULTISPECIES: FABP family protein [unclassified Streptomyces]|uniref:FABP family protein n=1 Tax=unclassified Streptomyces TaxID=2593676 RepID=UPI001BE89988|nr:MULTISPECIES: FABP family protein [unclassified Streptomyces]MBT2406421.1 FABP family protein [Streptomyces sp. ISL-21]MBT2455219.1 FABP family protein [Streptomyces sp. ISL-86]MBT2612744.1 FABP family protein [Streptomyces sp. ISL-87]